MTDSGTEPVLVYPSTRAQWETGHAAASSQKATAIEKVLFGPKLPTDAEQFALPDESEACAIARRTAYCANQSILSNAAEEIIGSCNADAFAQVCAIATGERKEMAGLIPAVVLYSGGNIADHEMVFPPLVHSLRQRCEWRINRQGTGPRPRWLHDSHGEAAAKLWFLAWE